MVRVKMDIRRCKKIEGTGTSSKERLVAERLPMPNVARWIQNMVAVATPKPSMIMPVRLMV